MALEVLTATHIKDGVWQFTCPIHSPLPFGSQSVSAPRQAMAALQKHMDDAHPGVTARLRTISQFSGTRSRIYTAPSNIKTSDLL